MATIHTFTPRSKRVGDLKSLYDYRSGVRVLACDDTFDVLEPHATALEALMIDREIGFGHAWRLADVNADLMAELDRVGVPYRVVSGAMVMPRDFKVVDELPPTPASMAAAELEMAA